MEDYFAAVVQGIIKGVTSFFVGRTLEEIQKTIQSPRKRKDGSHKR